MYYKRGEPFLEEVLKSIEDLKKCKVNMAKSITVTIVPAGSDNKVVMKKLGLSRAQAYRVMNEGVYVKKESAYSKAYAKIGFLFSHGSVKLLFKTEI